MYKCFDCGRIFETPHTWQEPRGEFWGMPCTETVSGCPYCDGDYEEVKGFGFQYDDAEAGENNDDD